MRLDFRDVEEFELLIEQHVGSRIRKLREELGLTQRQLAERLNISHQQVGKCERATNRVSAGRLYLIARALGCPMSDFFTGVEGRYRLSPGARSHRRKPQTDEEKAP